MRNESQVPEGWQAVQLRDVASVRRQQVMPAHDDSRPYVALKHIASGGALNGYGCASDSVSFKTMFHKGDTLYGKLRPNLRKVVRADFNGVCSTDIIPLYAHDHVDAPFLSHLIRSDLLHRYAMRAIAGTKMPRTSWTHIREYSFSLPPLPEQQAIAAVLDSIDEAIERTEAVVAATERLRDALLHGLLTRGVPGWHSEWKDAPGIGTIPACWDVVRLGDCLSDGPTNGVYKPESEYGVGTWLIRIIDFIPGAMTRLSGFERVQVSSEEQERYSVRQGDILINRVNSLSHLGKSVLIPQLDEPALFESNMMRLRFSSIVDPEYVMITLLDELSRRYFASRAKKAVQQASINQQDVSLLPIPLPNRPEQAMITEMSLTVRNRIVEDTTAVRGLKELKAATADALLMGRLRAT